MSVSASFSPPLHFLTTFIRPQYLSQWNIPHCGSRTAEVSHFQQQFCLLSVLLPRFPLLHVVLTHLWWLLVDIHRLNCFLLLHSKTGCRWSSLSPWLPRDLLPLGSWVETQCSGRCLSNTILPLGVPSIWFFKLQVMVDGPHICSFAF